MRTASKLILIILGLILAFFAVVGGGAWLWFQGNKDELMRQGELAEQAARAFARSHEQRECLDEAVLRYRRCEGFTCRIGNSLYVSTCLSAAQPTAKLCRDVPAPDELVELSRWTLQQCLARGLTEQCPAEVFSQWAQHCAATGPTQP